MKYKLIASDLDGTLLAPSGEITEENLAAVRSITDAGVLFVPVTGRALYEIPESVRECPSIRYIICSNGAVIYDRATGESERHCFTAERFAEIRSLVTEYTATMTVHCDLYSVADAHMTREMYEYYRVNEYYQAHIKQNNVLCDDFREYIALPHEAEMMSLFFRYDSELEECRERLLAMGDVDVTSSVAGNLELIRHGALKGAALTKLCDRLGISADAVIAVGDSSNDISMLKTAGTALAAANASEAVKAEADEVICSCIENIACDIWRKYVNVQNAQL